MPAGTGDFDLNNIPGRGDGTYPNPDHAGANFWLCVDRKDISDSLQDSQLNEFWGAGIHNFFRWLKDNANTDFYQSSTIRLREHTRQPEGNRDMDVMATCVHDARVL